MDVKKIGIFLTFTFLLILGLVVYFFRSKLAQNIGFTLPTRNNLTSEISKKIPSLLPKDTLGITKIPMEDNSVMYRVQGHFTEKLTEKFSFLSANFSINGISKDSVIPVFLVGKSGKMNFGKINTQNKEETIWTLTSGKEISEAIQPGSDIELTFVIRPNDVNSRNRQILLEKIIAEKKIDPNTALAPEMIRIL